MLAPDISPLGRGDVGHDRDPLIWLLGYFGDLLSWCFGYFGELGYFGGEFVLFEFLAHSPATYV
jgi:hypothetical protein